MLGYETLEAKCKPQNADTSLPTVQSPWPWLQYELALKSQVEPRPQSSVQVKSLEPSKSGEIFIGFMNRIKIIV